MQLCDEKILYKLVKYEKAYMYVSTTSFLYVKSLGTYIWVDGYVLANILCELCCKI